MKWKIKKNTLKDGDVRYRKVFAWKKTKVGDYWVWLETYEITERFFQSVGGNQSWWTEIKREPLFWHGY